MAHRESVDVPPGARVPRPRARVEEGLDRPPSLGPYKLVSILGRGGMATVYRARDERLGREVAVKILLPHLRREAIALRRFLQEARAVAKLRHEGIVAIHDVSPEEAVEPYLVVELVAGGSLREALRRAVPMAPEVAGELAASVLEALDHAHGAGIIHRDIKPENVLIERRSQEGGAVRVKLADFGIAKVMGQATVTNTGELVGSPAYMAPEQLEGAASDARSDVFSVGVMLYECLTGRRPFEGEGAAQVIRRIIAGRFVPAEQVIPSVGARWSSIVSTSLAPAPADRYPSARAMLSAVRAELVRTPLPAELDLGAWLVNPSETNAAVALCLEPALLVAARAACGAGDPLGMASELNRLLALEPTHAEARALLVRSSRRMRLRRHTLVGLAALAFAVAAAIALRVVRRPLAPEPIARVEPVPALFVPQPPTPRAELSPAVAALVPSGAPEGSAPRALATAVRGVRTPRAYPMPGGPVAGQVPPPAGRMLIVGALSPPFGVLLRIDSGPAAPVAEGVTVPLAPGAHVLQFECRNDACIPHSVPVGAAESVPHVAVTLRVRSARLRILSAPDRRFQLLEQPAVELHLGEDAEVPMRGSRATVHLVDLATGKQTVTHLTAGLVTTVSPE